MLAQGRMALAADARRRDGRLKPFLETTDVSGKKCVPQHCVPVGAVDASRRWRANASIPGSIERNWKNLTPAPRARGLSRALRSVAAILRRRSEAGARATIRPWLNFGHAVDAVGRVNCLSSTGVRARPLTRTTMSLQYRQTAAASFRSLSRGAFASRFHAPRGCGCLLSRLDA